MDSRNRRATVALHAGAGAPALQPGDGPVLGLFFTAPYWSGTAYNAIELVSYGNYRPRFVSQGTEYQPAALAGSVRFGCCLGQTGNVDGSPDETPSIGDVSRLVDHLFITREALGCYTEADIDQSGGPGATSENLTIGDLALLIDFLFIQDVVSELPGCP
jgi:hypothetical protein